MPQNSGYPAYLLSFSVIFNIICHIVTGKRLRFQKTAKGLIKGIQPPPVLKNTGVIPDSIPILVTMNHYSRQGFSIVWAAAALTSALPGDPIWLMTRAWTNRQAGLDRIRTRLTEIIFSRIAEVYGFVTMPPIPPHPDEIIDRAISIRRLMQALRMTDDLILCIAPEGRDFSDGTLGRPPEGTGKMILQLMKVLNRILPAGVYEKGGHLVLNFGSPYLLPDHIECDPEVADFVMQKIACLLPERMRGLYQNFEEKNT